MINDKTPVRVSSDAIAQMVKVSQYLDKENEHPVTSYDGVILYLCDKFLESK